MAQDFDFEESSHIYSRNGKIIPGCTRVLEHGGLSNYEMVHKAIMERKSALGRAVHDATLYYDLNDLNWATLDEQLKPYVDAWADFRAITGFVPRQREVQCIASVNGMEYGMQIDAEGLVKKYDALVEIKITTDIMPSHAIQLAGYALGLPMKRLDGDTPIDNALTRFYLRKRYAVQLLPSGKAKLHPFEDPQDAEVFLWQLGTCHWKLRKGIALKEAA